MFRSLLQSYRKLVKELSRAQMDANNVSREDIQDDEVEIPLENACCQINIFLREDGVFAIACDFTEYNDEIAEMAGMMLHMINSGNLAEYFIKSLNTLDLKIALRTNSMIFACIIFFLLFF